MVYYFTAPEFGDLRLAQLPHLTRVPTVGETLRVTKLYVYPRLDTACDMTNFASLHAICDRTARKKLRLTINSLNSHVDRQFEVSFRVAQYKSTEFLKPFDVKVTKVHRRV